MTFTLNKNDRELLLEVAEHRVLTVSQVAAARRQRKQVVRRRLRQLERVGFLSSVPRDLGKHIGRPEKLVFLTESGIHTLGTTVGFDAGGAFKELTAADSIGLQDHQLLLTWFRIHLDHLERLIPQASVQFLSPSSLLYQLDPNHLPLVFDPPNSEGGGQPSAGGFVPDGVFKLDRRDKDKAPLFFLEVDMGTEALASPTRGPRDIRQKVVNYQHCIQTRQYRRLERIWHCRFNGFRVLFLTNTQERLAALCRLVRQMPPSDFVWLSSADQMFSQGLSAAIWMRGGNTDASPQSILGPDLACRAVLPPPTE